MHLFVCLVGLLWLAWHTSGYAIDYAATSFEYDDEKHEDPTPAPAAKEGEKKKAFDIMKMTDAQIRAYKLVWFGDDDDYAYYDPLRPKRSVPEGKTGEKIDTTENINVPKESNELTINDTKGPIYTKDLQTAIEEAKHTNEDESRSQRTEAWQKINDSTKHAIENVEKLNKNTDLQKKEEVTDHIKTFQRTGDDELKAHSVEDLLVWIETLEHVIEQIDTIVKLEDVCLTMEEGQMDSLAEVERTERDSEWYGPIYPEYPWYPEYTWHPEYPWYPHWYPPMYPWGFYPAWPPYAYNPNPVPFPVYGGDFNCGVSDGGTVKQKVPVKGKVTISATFTDGTWTLPPSSSVSKVINPNIGQGISTNPATAEFATPYVKLGTVPVSGKSTFAAHFC